MTAHRYLTHVLYQRLCHAYLISMDAWEGWMLIIGVWWYRRGRVVIGQRLKGSEVNL